MLKVFKIPGGGCLWFLLKKRLLFYLTVIFSFREMIFNQENHVHTAAFLCKKTDAGYVGFFKAGNVFVLDCPIHCNAFDNKQISLTGV
jgi:hypothetical protein